MAACTAGGLDLTTTPTLSCLRSTMECLPESNTRGITFRQGVDPDLGLSFVFFTSVCLAALGS
jgi:hypothetical protein